MPAIDQLAINYRTHSGTCQERRRTGAKQARSDPNNPSRNLTSPGVLDVASLCIDFLQRLFPNAIDNLPRERAHFRGLAPILLGSLDVNDLMVLASGSNRDSQIEFGATGRVQRPHLPATYLPRVRGMFADLFAQARTRRSWCATCGLSRGCPSSCAARRW